MTAAIQIAQNPDNNVAGIYGLVKGSTAFEPTVTTAPSDWTLTLTYLVATPSISLATGTYTGTQNVTISDATPGSTIYYTTDGTVPTSSSSVYTAPISIAVSSTIKAIAVLTGSSSGVASSTLTITSANPPAKLAFVQQPSNALTGATMSPAVTVAVQDSNGNTLTSATNPVTLALTSGSGLTGTLTATPKNGVATFSNLSIGTAGSYTLAATSPSLASATSAGFSITAGGSAPLPPAKLAFVQQPSNALTGTTISPAVTVAVEDSNGNPVTSATNPITVALAAGTGLAGTLTATPQNGIASFSNLSVSAAGSYTLSATSTNLTAATSSGFAISTTTPVNTPAGTVATPVLSPAGGGTQTVTITTSTPGAGIWYTTDGSTPTLPPGGVPQGTSTGYSPMCNPISQPTGLINIESYGASPSASPAANTTAIQNACSAAGAPSSTSGIYIPAGTFQANAMTLNCNVYGQGPSSEIYSPTPTDEMITTTADNVVWSNWQHYAESDNSQDFVDYNIHLQGISNGRMDTMMIVGGNAGGIFNDHTTNELDTNSGMFNTYRDSNYHAGENSTPSGTGVTNPIVDHEYIYNNGDDGISFVSYGTGPLLVTGALAQWNNVAMSTCYIDCSRGITLPGGTNATFRNNLVQHQSSNAGIYIAQEAPSSYTESAVSNVLVQYNYLLNNSGSPTYNPCILLYSAAGGGSGGVTDVTVSGNYISGCAAGALGTYATNGPVANISFINNTVTGSNGLFSTSQGSPSNIQCTGNTYNGTSTNTGGSCSSTATGFTATGSPASYTGCVVGTAKQYTGPITVTSPATIKAVAVFPGLANSSVGSASYTSGTAATTPTF
jgi:Chitobiase/beta-hexosaminidase C-terminal domain